jgi:hypothetical protein
VTIHSNKGATGLTAPRTLRTERTARGRVPQLLVGLILLVGLACGGGVIIGGALTGCGVSSGVDAATTATVGATAGTGRTITSSTELHTPPTGSTPLSWLIDGDAFAAGITIVEADGGPGMTGVPVPLYLKALSTEGQDAAAYQAIAEKLLSLAEKYKQEIYFDQLHVVLVTEGGEALYDHTFEVTPPSSTTSTTQPFTVFYSAPGLQVTPREGVSLVAQVTKSSQGAVQVTVAITNSSASAFAFSQEDIQLYLNGVRLEPTPEVSDAPHEAAAGANAAWLLFFAPAQFDPNVAGLFYTSSDRQSVGFTASDGPVPTASN